MSVRVAICEDSRSFAHGLKAFLETDDDLDVVGITTRGEHLLADLERLQPDLVTMDLALPGIDGVQTTRRIMAAHPTAVVIISGLVGHDARTVAAALDAGALEAIRKSEVRLDERESPRAVALRRRLVRLAASSARTRGMTHAPPVAARAAPPVVPPNAAIVGIGASTGGPTALRTVLGALPADFSLPVLVVQHMAAGFTAGLVAWLDDVIALPVALAQDGHALGPGVVIAPDDAHLLADRRCVRLDVTTPGNPHRPSVDMLLQSLAAGFGRHAVGVVLTGMGADGADGVSALVRAGGVAITQPAETATLWAMPAAAAAAGAGVLDLDAIGPALAAGVRRP